MRLDNLQVTLGHLAELTILYLERQITGEVRPWRRCLSQLAGFDPPWLRHHHPRSRREPRFSSLELAPRGQIIRAP